MAQAIFWLVLITLIPTLELRASIPYGMIKTELGTATVVVACLLANIALAPIVWVFLDKGMHFFLRFDWIARLYEKVVGRARERLHPYVERWGTLGLALFVGVPLPGSGVYSGALGAYLLGFRFPQYMIASIVGVLLAGAAVTAVMISGVSAFDFVVKRGF